MQIENHTCLERRHTDRRQSSSEVALHPQHDFQQRPLILVLVLTPGITSGSSLSPPVASSQ